MKIHLHGFGYDLYALVVTPVLPVFDRYCEWLDQAGLVEPVYPLLD